MASNMYRNADNRLQRYEIRSWCLMKVLASKERQAIVFTGSLGGKVVRTCVPDGVLDLQSDLFLCDLFQACLLLRGHLQLGLWSYGLGTYGRMLYPQSFLRKGVSLGYVGLN